MPNTKTAQHTPGPWTVTSRRDGGYEITGAPNSSGTPPFHRYIARVMDAGALIGEAEANAFLIAAAPEGLSVAQDALNWWHSVPSHFLAKEPAWVQAARDFIRKATGGQP